METTIFLLNIMFLLQMFVTTFMYDYMNHQFNLVIINYLFIHLDKFHWEIIICQTLAITQNRSDFYS